MSILSIDNGWQITGHENIGPSLASSIDIANKANFEIHNKKSKFAFSNQYTAALSVQQIFNNLKPTPVLWANISANVLRHIRGSLVCPLSIILNQSL